MPELEAEVASARTVESACREVRGMFTDAYLRGRTSYQPWTSEVDDQVIRASPVVYNLRSVASPAQVDRLVANMAASTRWSVDARGRRVEASGARFAAMVMLAGKKGLREEELGGLRWSWLELDGDRPRIVLRGAEVYHPLDGGGRARVRVTLKHRPAGEIRIIDLTDTPDLVEALRSHLDLFCPRPDHESDDPDAIDPLVFTTHRDTPIDFSNWVGAWWKPCVAATFTDPTEEHLRGLWFTRLRAAAITAWLIDGRTLEWCARQAGNSQLIIEKHYKGIIDEIGYLGRPTTPTPPETALATVEVAEMSVAELAAAQARLADELTRRAMAG